MVKNILIDRDNQIMALLNTESSLMEIVKLIGATFRPTTRNLVLEIARVIRLGFLQQNAFHRMTLVFLLKKQYNMMEIILSSLQ